MSALPARVDREEIERREARRDQRERDRINAQGEKQARPAVATARSCADCMAWNPERFASRHRGYCQARPPVIAVTEGGVETCFPITNANQWCMGFKPAG